MKEFEIDITGVIDNMVFDEEKIKQYGGDYQKIATDLLRDNVRISLEKASLEQKNNSLQSKIDKANELIKNKLSTETYQHLKVLYDDIDSTEEIWEDYEFEDLLDILKEDK